LSVAAKHVILRPYVEGYPEFSQALVSRKGRRAKNAKRKTQRKQSVETKDGRLLVPATCYMILLIFNHPVPNKFGPPLLERKGGEFFNAASTGKICYWQEVRYELLKLSHEFEQITKIWG